MFRAEVYWGDGELSVITFPTREGAELNFAPGTIVRNTHGTALGTVTRLVVTEVQS